MSEFLRVMMTKFRLAVAALTVLPYLAVGLHPYDFTLPSTCIADNMAVFLPEGGPEFRPPGPGIARSDEPPP